MHLRAQAQRHAGRVRNASGALPITDAEFAAAMAALGPFESRPHLGVAVSGGRDSMALALLAQRWAQDRAGTLTALIVDHGLRPESTREAQTVAGRLEALGIACETLQWIADKPATGISEAARAARYSLLERRCRELEIFHLLLGHQSDDQAETIALRLADASGPEGLAGMSAIVETPALRLLRPLLEFDRARVAATVLANEASWIDDPSNEDEAYTRVRLRQRLERGTSDVLLEIAASSAELRREVDRRLAEILVDLVRADPCGFAWLDLRGFQSVPAALARRVLSRLAATYGGRHYPARQAGLEKAATALREGRSATAGGCLFDVRGRRALVCREPGAMGTPVAVEAMTTLLWDRRYRLTCPQTGELAPLESAGRRAALAGGLEILRDFPAPVAEALPGLRDQGDLKAVFVPKMAQCHSGTGDRRVAAAPATLIACLEAVFRPSRGLALPPWPLVLPPGRPMYLDGKSFSLRG